MKEVTDPKLLAQLNAPTAARRLSRADALTALEKADEAFNRGLPDLTPAQRKKAMQIFLANPKVVQLRRDAGLVAAQTKKGEIGRIAREQVDRKDRLRSGGIYNIPIVGAGLKKLSDFTDAAQAGLSEAAFGIPERINAGANYLLGNVPEARSYRNALAVEREAGEIRKDKSLTGNIIGQLMGGGMAGSAAAGAVRSGGTALAQVAPRAGNAIANLTRLETGRRGANALKIVGAGAAGGAAQALGEGENVAEGAAIGAVTAPIVIGGVKLAEWGTRPVRDLLRLTAGKTWLRRSVSESPEAIAARAAEFRRDTGTEPTLFEVLNAEDRQAVQALVRKVSSSQRERASDAVRGRVANMPGELSQRTAEITGPQQVKAARQIALDLADARGTPGKPTREEIALAQRAARDPTEMEAVRRTVSRSIMAPFDDQRAYETLDDIMPTQQRLEGSTVVDEVSDPEVANLIRSAAGARRMSPDGLTIRDVSDILSDLRDDIGRGGIEGRAAQRAVNHLEDKLASDYPDAAAAMQRMVDAFAGRSRMMEGVSEGRATRLRENIPVTKTGQARNVRNIYDTPEGSTGRAIGQRAEIMDNFGGTPNQAIARAGEIADAPIIQEALTRNLGDQAGRDIAAMSQAQAESLRRFGALRRGVTGEQQDIEADDLALAASLLSPTALIRTKAGAINIITRALAGIPEGRATALVDMLFSQDRRAVQQALNLLESTGERGRNALRELGAAAAIGAQGEDAVNYDYDNSTLPQAAPTALPQTEPAVSGEVTDPALLAALNAEQPSQEHYGRAVIEGLFPEAVITEDFRDADSELGRANPDSFHVQSDGAVDIRPIPGMTFEEFIQRIEDAGYSIIEAMNETGSNKSGHATGDHWHVVFE